MLEEAEIQSNLLIGPQLHFTFLMRQTTKSIILVTVFNVCHNSDPKHNITGIHPAELRAFETVREITDYLQIQANDPRFRTLGFFGNLRVIHGRVLDK